MLSFRKQNDLPFPLKEPTCPLHFCTNHGFWKGKRENLHFTFLPTNKMCSKMYHGTRQRFKQGKVNTKLFWNVPNTRRFTMRLLAIRPYFMKAVQIIWQSEHCYIKKNGQRFAKQSGRVGPEMSGNMCGTVDHFRTTERKHSSEGMNVWKSLWRQRAVVFTLLSQRCTTWSRGCRERMRMA